MNKEKLIELFSIQKKDEYKPRNSYKTVLDILSIGQHEYCIDWGFDVPNFNKKDGRKV